MPETNNLDSSNSNENKFSSEQISTKEQQPKPEAIDRKCNTTFSTSVQLKQEDNTSAEEDEEDTRNMTGRIRTKAGYEIDRASAGNCKLNEVEKQRDKETEDEYGYTMAKINKRYNMMRDLRRIEVNRPINTRVGLALAGHKDRQKMACFIAGVDPNGLFASADIRPGDEIVEVNGNVLKNRCHLNASVVFKNVDGEKLVLITSRREPNDEMCVLPLKKFPAFTDETKFLFDKFPKARAVQIRKEGFLGIMVIYGKHVEVGKGIFVSDLREGSNAELAGVKVGDMLLAVNKDVMLESNYDDAVALLKRVEGIVTLVLLTLKKATEEKTVAKVEKKKTIDEEKRRKEVEKLQDPSNVEITPNKKTLIEVKIEKKPLGVIVVGGKNNYVKTGCVITHIYPEGALARDNRLKIFDHIVEVNSLQIHCESMSTLKVHQLFHITYEKNLNLLVYRADPLELEKFNVNFTKKSGRELGLSLVPNEYGCTISDMISGQYSEFDNKLQRGDIITKFNGEALQGCTFTVCYALFKGANGKISLEITRPKPTLRTETPKT